MTTLQAVVWDVDGTLAETERDGHRVAFNMAFEQAGLPRRWEEAQYGELLVVTGGRERLLHDMYAWPEAPGSRGEREALARELHRSKNGFYAGLVAQGRISLRGGVLSLMEECRGQGVRMAVATTTSRVNLESLLRAQLGSRWADWFQVLVCGEDVESKKPAPDVYLKALQQLGLRPLETLAIEDSPGGVAAARAAGCPVLVTRSAYFLGAPIDAATAIGPGLHSLRGWKPAPGQASADGRVTLEDCRRWHSLAEVVSDFPRA